MRADFAFKRFQINEDLPYFIPGANIKRGEDWVLAHGAHAQAVLLADDCMIETVLGRGQEPRRNRRLLFAPLATGDKCEIQELEEANFGRFPLRADSVFDDDLIVDLRRCFMAEVGDVVDALYAGDFRQRSLDDEARADLSVRWSAYALRRGPFVAEDSLEKLADFLVNRGFGSNETIRAAQTLADVVATAWRFEGTAIEGAGNASDAQAAPADIIGLLVAELERLGAATNAALDAVRDLTSSNS